MSWGDNGSARPTTEAYINGFDRIFRRESNNVESEQPTTNQKPDSAAATQRQSNQVGANGCDSGKSDKGDDAQRIKELEAHSERLREFAKEVSEWEGGLSDKGKVLLTQTPTQLLREVRVEAVCGASDWLLLMSDKAPSDSALESNMMICVDLLRHYAKQLRSGDNKQ